MLLFAVLITASEALSVAWIPKEGEVVRREGYLYNHYPESSLNVEMPEGDLNFDLGGFKTIGIVGYERGMRKDVSLYMDFSLRHELHKIIIGDRNSDRSKISLQDISLDFELGVKKQLLNVAKQNTNDVITVFLGLAPGSTYILSEKKRLFSHNNSYLISGISYGRSFFSRYNGFAEVSIMDKIYFHDSLNEVLLNAAAGLKATDKAEISLGILATTGSKPYMSGGLEHVHRSLSRDLPTLDQSRTILDKELEKLLLPKRANKEINLYLSNSYNISDKKRITLNFSTEMPLSRRVWGVKVEFVVFN